MDLLGDVVSWFTTADHWSGGDGIVHRLWEHVAMSGLCTLAAMALALPVGVGLGHVGRGGTLAINVSNIGRAIPSFAVLVLAVQVLGLQGWGGFGARPAFVALLVLAVPPVLTNAYVGMREVDADAKEAARGMGMSGGQLLRRVELPLALPLVMAGVRTAAVQVVATATLAAVVGWGGLGRYIIDGFAQFDNVQIFAGATLVAALAMATELALGAVQRRLVPQPVRDRAEPAPAAQLPVPTPVS